MAFDREAAIADGYTEEEINRYLETKDQPLPAEVPRTRGEEQLGVVTSSIPEAAKLAGEVGLGYGVYKLGKGLLDAYKGGPVTPSQMSQASQMGQSVAQNVGQASQAAQNVSQGLRATGTGGAGAFNQMANQLSNNTIQFPKGNVPPTTQAPNMIQRGMDIANQMRQFAAQRVLPVAGVPGAVGAGGIAATGLAGGQMGAMTPQQRKQYYDNQMLGAMGGDAALAAAIMNRGQ